MLALTGLSCKTNVAVRISAFFNRGYAFLQFIPLEKKGEKKWTLSSVNGDW